MDPKLWIGCLLVLRGDACEGGLLNPQLVANSVFNERRLNGAGGMLNDDIDASGAHHRRLLAGDPPMSNNAFINDGGQAIMNKNGSTKNTFDIMEELAVARSEDICIFSMQQLPPPNADFSTATTDLQRFLELGFAAGTRFQAMSGANIHGGSAVMGHCITGWGGANALCDATLNTSFSCNDQRKNQSLKWPQAATIFKITSSNKAAALANLNNWRTVMTQHLEQITWVMSGGNPSAGGSNVGGWGANGGLRAKIVPCSVIPTAFHYPTISTPCDDISGNGELLSDTLYSSWLSLCSIWPAGGTCSTPTPTATPTAAPTPAPPSGATTVPETTSGTVKSSPWPLVAALLVGVGKRL